MATMEIEQAALLDAVELERPKGPTGWFNRLVAWHLKRRRGRKALERTDEVEGDQAHALIRRACLKAAASGAAVGSVSTGAALLTAQTEGLASIVTVPLAAGAIGLEMGFRTLVHLDLACDLAATFEVPYDLEDPDDLYRLYSLIFRTEGHDEESEDHGRALVHDVMSEETQEIGEKVGHRVLGESVARNLLPVLGIATSAVTNYLVTRKLGDTVRRYMRYRRALHDALEHASSECHEVLDLLIEGVWFVFSADGKLSPEEVGALAHLLQKLPLEERAKVQARFVEDELEWADRIEVLPEAARDEFLHALQVAAAVDKHVGLPERKILRRAAHHLGRPFDRERLEKMIREFEDYGVLKETKRAHKAPAAVAAAAPASRGAKGRKGKAG
jgi:ribosomal protein L12E/L44/L45/RPP1/RPP2